MTEMTHASFHVLAEQLEQAAHALRQAAAKPEPSDARPLNEDQRAVIEFYRLNPSAAMIDYQGSPRHGKGATGIIVTWLRAWRASQTAFEAWDATPASAPQDTLEATRLQWEMAKRAAEDLLPALYEVLAVERMHVTEGPDTPDRMLAAGARALSVLKDTGGEALSAQTVCAVVYDAMVEAAPAPEAVAWMDPKKSFAPEAFIWSSDARHSSYSEPVYTLTGLARPRFTPAQRKVLAFLAGEGQIDGCGFGDYHPGYPQDGREWWRRHLRSAFPALGATSTASRTSSTGGNSHA